MTSCSTASATSSRPSSRSSGAPRAGRATRAGPAASASATSPAASRAPPSGRRRSPPAPPAAGARVPHGPSGTSDDEVELGPPQRRPRDVLGSLGRVGGAAAEDEGVEPRRRRWLADGRHQLLAGPVDDRSPCGTEVVRRVVDERRHDVGRRLLADEHRRRLEGGQARIGQRLAGDGVDVLHGHAVDLPDLLHEQRDEVRRRQRHHELVDRHAGAPLEDVDADEVAAHGADPAGDGAERARTVGDPDPHDVGGHGPDATTGV